MTESSLISAPSTALIHPAIWSPAEWEETTRTPSPRTLTIYGGLAEQFRVWLAEQGLTLATATRPAINAFLARWPKARSRNLALVVLKHIYTEGQARGVVTKNPVATLRADKVKNKPRDYLRVSEVNDLFRAMVGDDLLALRDRALFAVAFETGMRRAELCGLRVGDLTKVGGHWAFSHSTKGSDDDDAVVSRIRPAAYEPVRAWLDASGPRPPEAPLFVRIIKRGQAVRNETVAYSIPDPMCSLKPGAVADRLAVWMVRAGQPKDRHLSAHAIRRSLITNALENGAPLYTVQRSVHHANPMTTEGYDANRMSVQSTAADYLPYDFGSQPPESETER
jgi:site-specific recombinase XerD